LATEPDENGLFLPEGFTSRIIAVAGEEVADTSYKWPAFPDGAACFESDDGGWIYACNSEVTYLHAPASGGVSAVRFNAEGEIVDAYAILERSTSNCAGGPTPWGTWMSCEEPIDSRGLLWECDPTGKTAAKAHKAMGLWRREAAAVDPVSKTVYMTEDQPDGLLYRYTPRNYPDLSDGLLEAALVDNHGAVSWKEVPDPSAQSGHTKDQVPGAARFDGGEGIWYHDDAVVFTTKGDNKLHHLNLRTQTHSVINTGKVDAEGELVLSGVDNVTIDGATGDIYVAEDGGNLEVVVISPDGSLNPFVRVSPEGHEGSEITGPCLSPDRTRLYFSSQRGPTTATLGDILADSDSTSAQCGITYEVRGPFRAAPKAPATIVRPAEGEAVSTGSSDGPPWPAIGIGLGAAGAIVGGAVALRRRAQDDRKVEHAVEPTVEQQPGA